MNLFQIDFVMNKTDDPDVGEVMHSLIDTDTERAIISLSPSSEKIASTSNYSREPRRLTFECFPDTWIEENILAGNNEHIRYISHYTAKIYRDSTLIFTGIIDTSVLSFDEVAGIISFTCYGYLKLFSIFSDLTHYYSLTAGYQPYWLLAYFIQDIESAIPINISYSNDLSIPADTIASVDIITITHIDYDDLLQLPVAANGWTYSIDAMGWGTPQFGYVIDEESNYVAFAFAHLVVVKGVKADVADTYKCRIRGRIVRIYNNICTVTQEYDEESDWQTDVADMVENMYNDMLQFFDDGGISEAQLDALDGSGSFDGRYYGSSGSAGEYAEADYYGRIFPDLLMPGQSYISLQETQTENMKALQAMLMLYNATICCDAAGTIILKSKAAVGATAVTVADNDVVSMVRKRMNQEQPDVTALDILAGDTTLLRGMIATYLNEVYDSRWTADIVVDQLDTYALELLGKISVKSNEYAISELLADFVQDEWKLTGWLI